MDKKLSSSQFIAGDNYSIADISIWPWTARFDWQEINLNEFPNVTRWENGRKTSSSKRLVSPTK